VIAGEKLEFRVFDEVRVGDLLAIQTDCIAEAMVTLAQSKRAMGRGGNLEIKIESVHLSSGETAPLRTIKDVKGEGHKAAMIAGMVATGVVYLPAATFCLMVQGKDAVIPQAGRSHCVHKWRRLA
jgi:hypothetical protein